MQRCRAWGAGRGAEDLGWDLGDGGAGAPAFLARP